MPTSPFPRIPKVEFAVNIDLDVAETLSAEVPVIITGSGSEFFDDKVSIESIGNRVLVKPSYELGTFDTYSIHRNGDVSIRTWGGLRDYGTPRGPQAPLRAGLAGILRAAGRAADATLAAKLSTIVERLERASTQGPY
jgi:hypothetical protein